MNKFCNICHNINNLRRKKRVNIMDNKKEVWLLMGVILAGIICGVAFGIYTYNKGSISSENIQNNEELAEVKNVESRDQNKNEIIQTVSSEEKISPNAIIIEKRYYKLCDHLIRESVEIPTDVINNTKEEFQKKYSGWKIESFSPTEITVYKEFKGMCNEHYIVKENNGVLGIYIENAQKIQEWQEDTQIDTKYLPEEDIEEFKTGVRIVGKTNLSMFLENYE